MWNKNKNENLLIYVSTFQPKIAAAKGEWIYIKKYQKGIPKTAKVLQI